MPISLIEGFFRNLPAYISRSVKLYQFIKLLAYPPAWVLHKLGVTANQVTATRFLTPFVFYFLSTLSPPWYAFPLVILFFAFTDAIDGVMAIQMENKPKENGGALLDPLADKFFVLSIYLYHRATFPVIVYITICGELLIAGLALLYLAYKAFTGKSEYGELKNIQTNTWGKFKLGLLLLTGFLMFLHQNFPSPKLSQAIVLFASGAILCLTMSMLTKVKRFS